MPEGAPALQSFDQLNHIFTHVGNIVRVQALSEKISGKGLGHIEHRNEPLLCTRLETAPFANILFRPEEIHGASGIGNVFEPFSKGDAGICDQAFGFCAEHSSVLHFHSNRRATIKTGCIDTDCFTREKPADRQRFEPSLAEPFLLAINSDTILGWKIVERRKRGDEIGVWIKPPREHGKGKELVNSFPPLFDGDA
jgi:hypothetical protein